MSDSVTVKGQPIDYAANNLLPERMRGGMRRYIENGAPPGHFLTAVLSNDLAEACSRADPINRQRLGDYSGWLYSYAPPGCHGSHEKVRAWLKERAAEAKEKAA